MKYFKHLFDSSAQALAAIFHENRHADKVIEYYFKNNKKWGKRDRQFVAESVYGCVRWWNKYVHLSDAEDLAPLEQAHRVMATHMVLQDQPLPPWYEGLVDPQAIRERASHLPPYLRDAFPEWLDARIGAELGPVWREVAVELNQQARVVLRANTLKTTTHQLAQNLLAENIHTEELDPQLPEGLILKERANVFATEAFQRGEFEVQDGSSQWVAEFVGAQPGERVIDACAGAGGKSLHLAARMQNKGKLISLDVIAWKLEELKKRARRAGVSIIEARHIESTKVIKRLHQSADALLLDVPCTGLGVLKRNPDTKWKLTEKTIEELLRTQQEILETYSSMVKPGGRMVYSTCSLLPSENQNQVEMFLKKHEEWTKIDEKIILPKTRGFDGFYMSLLRRK